MDQVNVTNSRSAQRLLNRDSPTLLKSLFAVHGGCYVEIGEDRRTRFRCVEVELAGLSPDHRHQIDRGVLNNFEPTEISAWRLGRKVGFKNATSLMKNWKGTA